MLNIRLLFAILPQSLIQMFFGSRANPDVRLLSGMNLIQLSRKQAVSGKNWPHLLSMSPVLLEPTKSDQLREVDRFLNAQLPHNLANSLAVDGPDAFQALIQCVLACFHRHEHFQVTGVPPLLSPDSKLFGLLQVQPQIATPVFGRDSDDGQNNNAVGPIPASPTTCSHLTSAMDNTVTAVSYSQAPSVSRSEPDSNSDSRRPGARNISAVVQSNNFAQSGNPQLHSAIWPRPICTTTISPPHSPPAPQPGFLCIDLVSLPDPDEVDLHGVDAEPGHVDSALNAKSTSNRVSFVPGGANASSSSSASSSSAGRRKEGRKSSASSMASSNHTSTSTVTNDTYSSMFIGRFALQISALATLQVRISFYIIFSEIFRLL